LEYRGCLPPSPTYFLNNGRIKRRERERGRERERERERERGRERGRGREGERASSLYNWGQRSTSFNSYQLYITPRQEATTRK